MIELNNKEMKDTVKGMNDSEMSELIQFLVNKIEELDKKVAELEKFLVIK